MIDVKKIRAAADQHVSQGGGHMGLDPATILELLDRLEAAERKRDEWADVLAEAIMYSAHIEEERDAMAAHVERLREALIERKRLAYIEKGMKVEQARIHAEAEVPHIDPATSLDRLKAQLLLGELEQLQTLFEPPEPVGSLGEVSRLVDQRVAGLRRQAEE